MGGTAYHKEDLIQEEKTHHILGKFNTVKNDIIEALKDHNFFVKISRIKVSKNSSNAQNDVLLTLNQSLVALPRR